jgi:hypothetical protein
LAVVVHRSSRASSLVGALAAVLAEVPADPLTPEVVAVPARGIERWIAQELSVRLDPRGRETIRWNPLEDPLGDRPHTQQGPGQKTL